VVWGGGVFQICGLNIWHKCLVELTSVLVKRVVGRGIWFFVSYIKNNFALDAWVTLILIIKLNVVSLLAKKENTIKEIPTHYFGSSWLHFHLFNQQLWYNSSSFLAPFSHKNPPLNIDLPTILILLISYNITFSLSHPHKIDCKV